MSTFQQPGPEYRGTELYMLNDTLEGPELDRQIGEMAAKGFHSFIARTYVGLKSDYPGPEFHQRVRDIIESSRRHGMKVFLQAGYMPAGVDNLPPEYASLGLRPIPAGEAREGAVLQSGNGTDYVLVPQPCCLDMLSKEACRFYALKSYEEMWAEFRGEFGKTVVSVWVDEPHFRPPDLPWTPGLPDAFRDQWGYDLRDKAHLLFEEEGDWQAVRYHYWRVVLRLLQEAYFMEISGWCRANNLLFSGHLMGEDTLFHQIANTCDCMPLYKYFDIPGIDYLTADLDWRHGAKAGHGDHYLFVNTPLQCVSAARQAGKDRILCEMFGVSKQDLTFRDQRYLFDFFASLGINHKMTHAVFYSLRGRSKRAYPPHVNYYQPYWEQYGHLNDTFARVSWFISQGEPVSDILVLHPIEAAFATYEGRRDNNAPLLENDRAFNELLKRLLAAHLPFDLGDEETIAGWGKAEGARFTVGKMSYKTAVLPGLAVLRESTLALLEAFASQGGRVILEGEAPALLDGRPWDAARLLALPGLERTGDDGGLVALLAKGNTGLALDCDGDASDVFLNVRREKGGRRILAFNLNRETGRRATIRLPGTYAAFLCRAETGGEEPCPAVTAEGRTAVTLALEPGGSALLRLEEQAEQAPEYRLPVSGRFLEYRDGFNLRRLAPNALVLDMASFAREDGDFSPRYPVLAIQELLLEEGYRGQVTLRYEILCDRALAGLSLALEEPRLHSAAWNGAAVDMTPAGHYHERCFATVALPDAAKPGVNVLELERRFEPPREARSHYSALYENLGGVELESVYLLGDFAVKAETEVSDTGCIKLLPRFVLDAEQPCPVGELVTHGYPFYAGAVAYSRTVELDGIPEGRCDLELLGFRGCVATVRVNGREAGVTAWEPYGVEVTGLLRPGPNEVTVTIANTLRNLLGPYHRPDGDPNHCWGSYGSPNAPWIGRENQITGERDDRWYERRWPDSSRWTESYLQVPFGLSGFRLAFR